MDHSHHHPSHSNKQEQVQAPQSLPHKGEQDHSSHDKHAGHHTEDFLKRFWICLALTIPVLLLSEMIQHWFGFHISFKGDKYVLLALGSIILYIRRYAISERNGHRDKT